MSYGRIFWMKTLKCKILAAEKYILQIQIQFQENIWVLKNVHGVKFLVRQLLVIKHVKIFALQYLFCSGFYQNFVTLLAKVS